jgi:hypothetical protein
LEASQQHCSCVKAKVNQLHETRAAYQERRAFGESETNLSSSVSGLLGTGITVSRCWGEGFCFAFFFVGMAGRLGGAEDGLTGCLLTAPELLLLPLFTPRVTGFICGCQLAIKIAPCVKTTQNAFEWH